LQQFVNALSAFKRAKKQNPIWKAFLDGWSRSDLGVYGKGKDRYLLVATVAQPHQIVGDRTGGNEQVVCTLDRGHANCSLMPPVQWAT
jgi:hypothetical protein